MARVHLDFDAHVLGVELDDACRADVSFVVASATIKTLHTLEVSSEHVFVVDLVVEEDAAKETQELGRPTRRESAEQLVRVVADGPLKLDVVDDLARGRVRLTAGRRR